MLGHVKSTALGSEESIQRATPAAQVSSSLLLCSQGEGFGSGDTARRFGGSVPTQFPNLQTGNLFPDGSRNCPKLNILPSISHGCPAPQRRFALKKPPWRSMIFLLLLALQHPASEGRLASLPPVWSPGHLENRTKAWKAHSSPQTLWFQVHQVLQADNPDLCSPLRL